jgi:hypothetical protein
MKRAITHIGVALVFFDLGAASVYLLKHERAYSWISVTSDGAGFGMQENALNGDIPWPDTTRPSGQVKFLNRDKGEQLGYVLKLPIKSNPTSALPAKYRQTTKEKNGLEIGPPDQVLYEGHFQFTLKDGDGFVLLKMDGPRVVIATSESHLGTRTRCCRDECPEVVSSISYYFRHLSPHSRLLTRS